MNYEETGCWPAEVGLTQRRYARLELHVCFAGSRCVFVYLGFERGGCVCVWEDEKMKGSVKVRATVPGYQVYCLEEQQHD